jgi:hypothetical protein
MKMRFSDKQQKRKHTGTPIGYQHTWNYRHTGGKEEGRSFTYYQTKSRGVKARGMGGMKPGSQIIWQIQGIERIKPLGRRLMLHIMKGVKRQGAYKLRGKRWVKTRLTKATGQKSR